jgi:hypothetical protein
VKHDEQVRIDLRKINHGDDTYHEPSLAIMTFFGYVSIIQMLSLDQASTMVDAALRQGAALGCAPLTVAESSR